MNPKIVSSTLLFALLVTVGAQAQDLVPYALDASDFLHPNKWKARETGAVLDVRRVISGGTLNLMSRAATSGPSEYGVSLVDTDATALEATITVHRAVAVNQLDRARLWLSMTAFNSSGSGAPGDATGDVRAFISLQRRPGQLSSDSALDTEYYVVVCPDAACNWTTAHRTGDFGAAVKAQVGIPVTLQILWEPSTGQFIFKKDDTTLPVSYDLNEGSTPGAPEEFIALVNNGVGTKMDVLVSDVKVSNR